MGNQKKERIRKRATSKMIKPKAFVLSLLGLTAAARMLSADNTMQKDDHFVDHLSNEAGRIC